MYVQKARGVMVSVGAFLLAGGVMVDLDRRRITICESLSLARPWIPAPSAVAFQQYR